MQKALEWRGVVGIAMAVVLLGVDAHQDVPLNEIQVLHAHNSYHLAPEDSISDIFDSQLIRALVADRADVDLQAFSQGSQYSYPSVFDLLDEWSVRSLEFDCFYDPEGGHYSHPAARKLAGSQKPFPTKELDQPGWKVMHIPDIDFNSSCLTLIACLNQVQQWSSLNQDHLPLFISIEPTVYDPESILGDGLVDVVNTLLTQSEGQPTELTASVPINRTAIRNLLSEILSVFDMSQIITPAEIKGNASTLKEAIASSGWPLLSSLRGRVLFIMSPVYTNDLLAIFPSLEDSPIFPSAYEDRIDDEDTVFVAVHATEPALPTNKSEWNASVTELVKDVRLFVDDGYVVRAFADYGTREARETYFTRRDRVIQSGAHLIATDYPGGLQSDAFDSNYTVTLPDNTIASCNSRSANAACQSIQTTSTTPLTFAPAPIPSAAIEPEIMEEFSEINASYTTNISVVLTICVLLLLNIALL